MEESYLFYRNIWINNFLDSDEQMKLLELLDSADEDSIVNIVQRLTLANIGLVHRAVKEFMRHSDKIPYDDLMSLGILGTINAIEKYDSSKGKISTYIYACAKRNLKEFAKSNSAIKIEKHFYNKISGYNRCVDQYYVKNGSKPSLQFIKDNTGLSDLDILLIETTHVNSVSLFEPIDDDTTLIDCVESDGSSIQQIIELKELKSILMKNLLKLSDVEIKILCCRYGLGSNVTMTQEEVARMMNCSHQNVSRLERKALTKLRNVKALKNAYFA